jgi:hypothetical protein
MRFSPTHATCTACPDEISLCWDFLATRLSRAAAAMAIYRVREDLAAAEAPAAAWEL